MADRASNGAISGRLPAVDALRGLIIVLMALDHANHFVAQKHSPGEYWGGPFPTYADALPFLTRVVTHLAAPGFFFLMGAGMVLYKAKQTRNGRGRAQIVAHFWIRGGLLIALQFLLINRAWQMSPGGWGPAIYVGVLFALGGAMIVGSLLLWLKPFPLLLLAVGLFIATETVHPDPASWGRVHFSVAQLLLLHPGGDLRLWSNYPILPWLEVAILGLAFGHGLARRPRHTYREGLLAGAVMLVLFVLIRALNGLGNIRPVAGRTWIDFFNVVKYPPSWAFMLLTTGANLVILWLLDRVARRHSSILRPLAVFGRAPLFFYILHLFLYAALGSVFTPEGTSIARMLPFWLLGLAILFPLCAGYSRLRRYPVAGAVLGYF
jgi:uncharacterized membrane protein